jgi:hypothetical protein
VRLTHSVGLQTGYIFAKRMEAAFLVETMEGTEHGAAVSSDARPAFGLGRLTAGRAMFGRATTWRRTESRVNNGP